MGHSKGNPKRKLHSHQCIYKNDRKISNKQPNAVSPTPRKTRTNKPQNEQKEKIIK
jgi:hypothetical protein